MSAPITLRPDQLERLAAFLRAISAARREHDVSLTPYGAIHVAIDGNVLQVQWDADAETFRIDDKAGS